MINSKVVNTINPSRTEFPKLMISTTNLIVLFVGADKGVVVKSDNDFCYIGEYSECWDNSAFTNFNGKVELSNA